MADEITTAITANTRVLNDISKLMQSDGSLGGGSVLKGRGQLDKMAEAEEKVNKKVFDSIRRRMSKSSDKYTRELAKNVKSLAELREAKEKAFKFDKKVYNDLQVKIKSGTLAAGELEETMTRLDIVEADLTKTAEELDKQMSKLPETIGDVDMQLQQAGNRAEFAGKALNVLKIAAVAVAKQMYDVTEASMRTGLDMTAAQIYQSRLMGMSQVELIETQGQYRNAIESSKMSSDEFSQMMKESSHSLFAYTGSLKEGAIFAAENTRAFRTLGAAGLTNKEYLDAQAKSFINLHNTLSITTDEFKDMNRQMLDSQSTREQLFKLDRSRRSAYFTELVQLREKLMINGLTKEAALSAIDAMQKIGAEDPKSRLKKAAQTQALAGAMGMSAEDASRMAALIRSGARGEGEADELMNLRKQLTIAVQEGQASKDLGREMQVSQLLAATGGLDYGAGGAFADLATTEARKVEVELDENGKATTKNTTALEDLTVATMKAAQIAKSALSEGPVGALASIFSVTEGLASLKLLFGGGAAGVGGIGGIGTGIASTAATATTAVTGAATATGAAMTAAGATLATTAAVAAGAGAVGYAVGTAVEKTMMHFFPDFMAKSGDMIFGGIADAVDSVQSLFGIEDTEEEKSIKEGRKLIAEMRAKQTDELIELQKESNTIARGRGHAAAGQAREQTDAVNNQTRETKFAGRKTYMRAGRSKTQ